MVERVVCVFHINIKYILFLVIFSQEFTSLENRVDKSIKISLEYIRITPKTDCLSLWLEWFCWNFITQL